MSQLIIISIACASLVAAVLVPVVRATFRALRITDQPDRERKLHAHAVSLGGGVAIFFTVGITFAIVMSGDRYLGDGILGNLSIQWYRLFFAAGALMLIGLADDAFTLRGRQKLLLQILVVISVVGDGTLVASVDLFGMPVHLGVFSYPLTVLWLLAAINALNLIDGADGMASTAGAIISFGLSVLCVQSGAYLGAAVAAALAGSLLGFLIYNRPPATIYLGDAGSMVIGLFVGVISIWSSVKGSTLLSFAPLMVLTIPLFDSAIALLRRVLTGRSIYSADRGHLHHRLLDRYSHPMMLVVVAVLCSITTATAILSVQFGQQWIAIAGVLLSIGLLVGSQSFGNAELKMFLSHTARFGESLLARGRVGQPYFHQKSIQLQGNRRWDLLWTSLVEFAAERGLAQIKLDVDIAWMQEGYHGVWRQVQMPDRMEQASLKIPIFVDQRLIGRLEAIGDARQPHVFDTLQLFIERTSDLGAQIRLITEPMAETPIAVTTAQQALLEAVER